MRTRDVDVAGGADADRDGVVLRAQLPHDLDNDIDDVLRVVARGAPSGARQHLALGVDDPRRHLRPPDVHADRKGHVSRSIRSTPLRPLLRAWSWVSTTVRTAARNAVVASARWVNVSGRARRARSEEHTSELQSRQYLVCRLLLEKKNLSKD